MEMFDKKNAVAYYGGELKQCQAKKWNHTLHENVGQWKDLRFKNDMFSQNILFNQTKLYLY